MFATFHGEGDASLFFDYINNQHPNIKFTKENNQNGVSNLNSFNASVHQKPTYIELLINFKSFTP